MFITFGLRLDGERGWRPANRLGMPVCCPLGLLNVLETRLGLLPTAVSGCDEARVFAAE